MRIEIIENKINLVIEVTGDRDVRLLHLSSLPFTEAAKDDEALEKFRLVEIHETGLNPKLHHGTKHIGTCPGYLLKYKEHRNFNNACGRKLEVVQEYQGLTVTSHIQFYNGVSVIRSWTEMYNSGKDDRPLEAVSSFVLTGLSKASVLPRDSDGVIHIPHNTWYGEAQWRSYSLPELGYNIVNDFSMKKISLNHTGTWASCEYLPMGCYENTSLNTALTWQIETSASWYWEISDVCEQLYLHISGPIYPEGQFLKNLKPNETFVSVPCAVAIVEGGFEKSIQELTKYRRIIRRKNEDNENPKVIFNDYMNCLSGEPTTAALIPLIDAAADTGCGYFCIDCGWYDDGDWWDGVGEWLPSEKRFPKGIEEPLDYIREKGMIPGLWLELEVMGINSPMVKKVTKDWFFIRNGRPVIEEGRYQLDFRNPDVIGHANSVIERLVNEYGVGYIKMDYNINAGAGTEREADSPGEGLLSHTRAYLNWLDGVFEKYPQLVIENCSSGGMRMEYSHLSRHSIQSVSDQTDYLKMGAIAANCMTAVTPEQAAIWSYPLRSGDIEEVVFNMVSCVLFRIHQSGHLAEMTPERLKYVKEGIRYHKQIIASLAKGLPFWPIGLAAMGGEYFCAGIDCGEILYLAVWRVTGGKSSVSLPIKQAFGKRADVKCSYPASLATDYYFDCEQGVLTVKLEEKTARIFEIGLA